MGSAGVLVANAYVAIMFRLFMSRYVDVYPHVFPSLPHTYVKTTYGHLYACITTHQKEKRQRADKQPKLQFQHFALV